MKTIVLASASPRRKELLAQIGLAFRICPSLKEEKMIPGPPDAVVQELSRQKAMDVASYMEIGTIVIGADTVVAIDGEILGKPGTTERAVQMLWKLQGRSHQVYTGVTIVDKGKDGDECITFYEATTVTFYPMSQEEIRRYAATGEPLDKAGAYGIQGCFAAYVESIRGSYHNIVGLPVGRLYQELKARLEE